MFFFCFFFREVDNEEIIPYDTVGSYDVQSNNIGVVNVGHNAGWGQIPISRSYAFGAVVTQSKLSLNIYTE